MFLLLVAFDFCLRNPTHFWTTSTDEVAWRLQRLIGRHPNGTRCRVRNRKKSGKAKKRGGGAWLGTGRWGLRALKSATCDHNEQNNGQSILNGGILILMMTARPKLPFGGCKDYYLAATARRRRQAAARPLVGPPHALCFECPRLVQL